jgi:hypothetical protein
VSKNDDLKENQKGCRKAFFAASSHVARVLMIFSQDFSSVSESESDEMNSRLLAQNGILNLRAKPTHVGDSLPISRG